MALGQNLISIHAPREGGDRFLVAGLGRHEHFNPRPPRGGRRPDGTAIRSRSTISIHAPREGGDAPLTKILRNLSISIHAPREGGDSLD